MKRRVGVIGVGLGRFAPTLDEAQLTSQAVEAGRRALADAGVAASQVRVACAAHADDPERRAHWLNPLGLDEAALLGAVPGMSTLRQAIRAIEDGTADCVLALGFDTPELESASLANRGERFDGFRDGAVAPALARYGHCAEEYQKRYGARAETFAMAAVTAREHASRNPAALFGQRLSLDEVLASERLAGPLTRLQFCEAAYGAAAVVLRAEDAARQPGTRAPVLVAAHVALTEASRLAEPPVVGNGYALNVAAAQQVYELAGIGPQDIDVCELLDKCTAGAILLYEALGFCREGQAERFIEDGDNTYGGNMIINPSGGLLGNGYSLAASDLAQCAELVWQLRGEAGARQVPRARTALQQHLGPDGASEITLYRRG